MNSDSHEITDDMLPEYDFSQGKRGKFYDKYQQSNNVIILDPDIAEIFKDSQSVNEALRLLIQIYRTSITNQMSK